MRFRPCLEVLLGMREPSDATGDLKSLTDYATYMSSSTDMNFSRWHNFNASDLPVKTGANYKENIEYLYNFLLPRMAYLDSIWLD